MLAIYKKELKSYLTSMQGYVFMAFIMLVLGHQREIGKDDA